jgi:hypothetical protein
LELAVQDEPDFLREELRDAHTQIEILKAEDQTNRILAAREEAEGRKQSLASEERRLESLKQYGRELASRAGLPPELRARAVRELEAFVTPVQFPHSISREESEQFLGSKIEELVREHRQDLERAGAERRRQTQLLAEKMTRQADEARVKGLVELGVRRAESRTLFWDDADREDVRGAVRDELESEVEPNWSADRVLELAEAVIEEWLDDVEQDEGEDGLDGEDEP